jgi:hypothetical protein
MRAHYDAMEKQPAKSQANTRASYSYNRSDNLLTLTPQQR